MHIKINLNELLQNLQNLNFQQASDDRLVELLFHINLVEDAEQNLSSKLDRHNQSLISQIKELSIPLRKELEARGLESTNVLQVINDNPDLIVESFFEMPLMQFIDLYENLQLEAKEDPDCEPLYQMAAEVLQQRIRQPSMPS